MMRTTRNALMVSALLLVSTGTGHAQEESRDALVEAATALAGGSEMRAWKLFSEHADAFDAHLDTLPPAFVVWVADQYRGQRRYAEATAIADKVVGGLATFGPDAVARAMLVKGDALRDQENYAAARLEYQSLERSTELRNTAAGKASRFRLVEIHRLTKNYTAAEESLERLRDSRDMETQAETYFQSAMIAFDREAYDEARELVAEARKRNPAHIEALFLEAKLNLIEDRLQDPELEIGTRVLSSYVIPGRPVTLKMQDRNLAIVRGGTGIPVTLETSAGGDIEQVSLLPSPRDPTLFRATVHSKLGEAVPGNLSLEVNGSDVVTYRMNEAFQKANDLAYAEKKMIVASDAELTASSGAFLSEAQLDQLLLDSRMAQSNPDADRRAAYERVRDTRVIRPGNDIHVQVVDADRDRGPELDQVFVECRASSGDRISGVALTETAPHSATFRAAVPTARAAPTASATGTVAGSDPFAPLSTLTTGVWSGAGEDVAFAVDLMAIHPLDHANLTLSGDCGLQRVRLFSDLGEDATELATTDVQPQVRYGYVDLAAHFGEKVVKTSAYLYTEVTSDRDQPAVLKIGSCDGVVCWVNAERVHNNQGGRLWKPEEDVVDVKLQAGLNAILLRVTQLTGPWGVSVTLLDSMGKGLPGVPTPDPLQPGVISAWYLFDRLTPENIKVSPTINVNRPIRVAGEFFYWVPLDVCPPASLRQEGNALMATFNRPIGVRHLRWTFEAFSGPRVSIAGVDVKNHFGEQVLPVEIDYSVAAANRSLELGPGDTVSILYTDERRISTEEILEAELAARFHDATVAFEYDIIEMTRGGEREVLYDEALRYRAGETDHLVVRVIDYDADTSEQPDVVKVLVESGAEETLWLEALETLPHSGVFVGILRLGTATAGDTIRVGPDRHLSATYQDRENTDGVLARTTRVLEAADDAPDLMAYRSVVTVQEPPEGTTLAEVKPVITQTAVTGDSAQGPVTTSMAAPLTFRAIYPDAALRTDSTLKARVSVVSADGRAPAGDAAHREAEVMMTVLDGKLAEFGGTVRIMGGESPAGDDDALLTRREIKDPPPVLDARGGDTIKVTVASLDGSVVREISYRMATDARLQFTDRKYRDAEDYLHVGDYLYVAVTDQDMDETDGLDTATVRLACGGVEREMTLAETLPRSGRFTGRVKTVPESVTGDGDALPAAFGGMIKATYQDALCVTNAETRDVVAVLQVYTGDQGDISGFSKRFSEEDIAVRTRLLTAEALFEMAKDYRATDQAALANDRLAEGRIILEEAIADYPQTEHAPHAEYLLGDLAQELEKYGEALGRYNKVLSTWPDSEFAARAQLRKGICLEKMEDFDNAMDAYVELTYLYPKSELVSDAVIRLGQYFYRTEAFDVAGRIFARFEAQHPEHPLAAKTLFLAAQSFMKGAQQQKDSAAGPNTAADDMLTQAADSFERLIEAYDDKDLRAESMYWLADCRMKQGDFKHAYMAFKGLTIDYPETKWAKFARGQLVQNERAFSNVTE